MIKILSNPGLWLAWQEALTTLISTRRQESSAPPLTSEFLLGDKQQVLNICNAVQQVLKTPVVKDTAKIGNYMWPHNLGPHGNAAFVLHTLLLLDNEVGSQTMVEMVQKYSFFNILLDCLLFFSSWSRSGEQWIDTRTTLMDTFRLLFLCLPKSYIHEALASKYQQTNMDTPGTVYFAIKPLVSWILPSLKRVHSDNIFPYSFLSSY